MREKTGGKNVKIPKCEPCQNVKQDRNPKSGTRQIKDKGVGGYLKRNKLEPCKLIFYYQYKSRLTGRVFRNR